MGMTQCKNMTKKQERYGKSHPVCELSMKFRMVFLELGLDEIINPMIVDEEDVYLQYGPEAPLILDRVYFLAGLDRAEIGLSKERIIRIKEIIPEFEAVDNLKKFLRQYKEGEIEADDFVDGLAKTLKIDELSAIRLVDEVFNELKGLRPIPMKKTLRSHMTALWYKTLANLEDKDPLPIRLFSIGPRFRREQRQDASHLFESTSASVVIMDDKFTLDDGKKLTEEILRKLGFSGAEFKLKAVTSNYYAPDTDTEIYINWNNQLIEIANLGFYSQASLANYRITHPVFNIGFGVERMALLLSGETDIRTLVYSQFTEVANLTDTEIAVSLKPIKSPSSKGISIAKEIANVCLENKTKTGPAEVLVYDGFMEQRKIKVWVYNWDEGKPLLSYAASNEVYVSDGEIFGLPSKETITTAKLPPYFDKVYQNGINTGLKFIELISRGFISELEEKIKTHSAGFIFDGIQFKIVKLPSEINLHIPAYVYRYITGRQKRILVGGPLFFGLRALLED